MLGCDMHIKWHIVGASEAHNGCLVLVSCFLLGGLGVVIGTDGFCRAKPGRRGNGCALYVPRGRAGPTGRTFGQMRRNSPNGQS